MFPHPPEGTADTLEVKMIDRFVVFFVSESEYSKLQEACPHDFPFTYEQFVQRVEDGIREVPENVTIVKTDVNVAEFLAWCADAKVKPDNKTRAKYALWLDHKNSLQFMFEDLNFPQPPDVTDEELERCRASGDYCPVVFEWYKYVGLISNFFASIRIDSPALRPLPKQHYYILVGLLNRCARLMLANVALSHEGLFGETTAIIDRCIFESAVKLQWLCRKGTDDAFARFITEGLKTEVEFKDQIQVFIAERNGVPLQIEKRMLDSINHAISDSGFSEQQIRESSKLPSLADVIRDLRHHRVLYVIGQKIGSLHVHGTWPSLRMHYLTERKDGLLGPRDHDCPTHVNQYVFFPRVVLHAMSAFADFVCSDTEDARALKGFLDAVSGEIEKLNAEVVGNDFEFATEL
jgi:hypothetical protein